MPGLDVLGQVVVGPGSLSAPHRVLPPRDPGIPAEQGPPAAVVVCQFIPALDHVVVPLVSQYLRHRPHHRRSTRRELIPAAHIADVTAAPADREQPHEVRVDTPLPSSLVDLHGPVLAADNLGTRHVGKQPERVNQPSHRRDHVALDLRSTRRALPIAAAELGTVDTRQSCLNHGSIVRDLDDRLGLDLCPPASPRPATHAPSLITAPPSRAEAAAIPALASALPAMSTRSR